jgi:hypothetical protein
MKLVNRRKILECESFRIFTGSSQCVQNRAVQTTLSVVIMDFIGRSVGWHYPETPVNR